MLKKDITFEDFNGEKVTETFYFNLTKAELAEMMLTAPGNDLSSHIKGIIASNSGKQIIATFKEIIEKSYGVRSEDGRYFTKTPEAWLRFVSSPAYSELFMELVTDAAAGVKFISGLVPSDLADQIPSEMLKSESAVAGDGPAEESDDWHDYSQAQLLAMPQDKFDALMGTDIQRMSKKQLAIAMQRKSNARSGG